MIFEIAKLGYQGDGDPEHPSKSYFSVLQKNKIIKTFRQKQQAEVFIKFLKSNGAFRGEIPAFMFNGQ